MFGFCNKIIFFAIFVGPAMSRRNNYVEKNYSKEMKRIEPNYYNLGNSLFDENFVANNNNTLIQVQEGSTAIFKCVVKNMKNGVIIWKKEDTLLTVGNHKTVYTNKRFSAKSTSNSLTTIWELYIKLVQTSDKGQYKCEVYNKESNRREKMIFALEIVTSIAKIIGGNYKEVVERRPLLLSCVFNSTLEPPRYIFWYHWDKVINYDLDDGATIRQGRQGSELLFPRAKLKHAGNYSCVPSNARQASVIVVIKSKNGTFRNINGGVTCHLQDHIFNMVLLVMALLNLNVTTMQIV